MQAPTTRLAAVARAALWLAAAALVGCESAGRGDDAGGTGNGAGVSAGAASAPVASDFDVGEVRTPAEYLQESRYQDADLRRGEILSLACRACHTLGVGQAHQLGPNLHGMFGRKAATLPGFEYSDALRDAGIVWTPKALDAWLQHPSGFIPGNTMVFAGLRADADRRDLIAYLLGATVGD